MTRNSPIIIGHRGAAGYRPEHSRDAYELAFAMGADAVEPDIVATRDGVLVVRHENEISGTTDIAGRSEFADRRTTKTVDGVVHTGWFTEDFTWDELSTLRCIERLPAIRPHSAAFDGQQPILRFTELLELVSRAGRQLGRRIGVVAEIKHATFFARIGLDLVPLILRDLQAAGWADGHQHLIVESFEQDALTRLQAAGLPASYVYLMEAEGQAADIAAASGGAGPGYADQRSATALATLAGQVDGISLDKRIILDPDRAGRVRGPSAVVASAQAHGLRVFTWTARAENRFLARAFRTGAPAAFGDYAAEWAVLRDAGIDGVFVDHPDLGVEVFRTAQCDQP